MPEDTESRLRNAAEKRLGASFASKATPEMLELLAARAAGVLAKSPVPEFAVLEIEQAALPATEAIAKALPGRQAAVEALRAEFNAKAAPIVAELAAPALEFGVQPAIETCWLIRAIRSPLDEMTLATIAGHPSIDRIDMPRRLELEAQTLFGKLMSAAAFRTAKGLTGKDVIVAVIDSEVLLSPQVFQSRVTHKRNYTDEEFGSAGDHGTAVASIIGANSADLVGVAPEATLWSYKLFPTVGVADDFQGALALQNAVEDGADVANCSWGAGPAGAGTSREAKAADAAWGLGLVVVKSAGNRGPNANTLTTPADAAGIITVGATNNAGKAIAQYSSRGTIGTEARPHLCAPGGGDTESLTGLRPNGTIGKIGVGTSYAAPHVVGAIALLLQQDKTLTPDAIRTKLLGMCKKLKNVAAGAQGAGMLVLA